MIIGFVGKGGSGKSTITTAMVNFLVKENKKVLAIDADHNMDLSFNLNSPENIPYLGESLVEAKKYLGMENIYHYQDIFKENLDLRFNLNPADEFTKKYLTPLSTNLSLMVTGPHTEKVLFGESCSHSLGTVLKIYLPLLDLKSNEVVLIDEKAGRDGVGTGVVTGWDVAIIISEPTSHSLKAGLQIAEILDFFKTPYEFVINKSETEHCSLPIKLPKDPIVCIPKSNDSGKNSEILINETYLNLIKQKIETIYEKNEPSRLNRSREKFLKNIDYQNSAN